MPYWVFIILFALMMLLPRLRSIHLGGIVHLDFTDEQQSLENKDKKRKQLPEAPLDRDDS